MAEENETTFRRTLHRAVVVEWEIKDFLNLKRNNYSRLSSPTFWASNAKWEILVSVHASGEEDYLSLYLRKITGKDRFLSPVTISVKVNDRMIKLETFERPLERGASTWGSSHFLKRWDLTTYTFLLKTVTVGCSVPEICIIHKDDVSTATSISGNSVRILMKNFEDMFLSETLSDIKIKVGSKEFSAHKAILAARSPVFFSMFEHEMTEHVNGIVDIPDCDSTSFELFLRYLYTGNVDTAAVSNIQSLYRIADKYFLKDLKESCCAWMAEGLDIDSICDVLELAICHQETELLNTAINLFAEHSMDIFMTEKWRNFNLDKSSIANDILREMAIISRKPKHYIE